MKNMLLALILTTTAAQAGPPEKWAENPGPHVIKFTQFSCQNVAIYDGLVLKITNNSNPLDRQEGWDRFRARTNLDDPANAGALCLTLKKGTKVMVEKRYGTYECVRFKGMPIAARPYDDTCFWAKSVSSNPNIMVPGVDLYWVE
ncbi:MAG: hypothetical protein ABW003_27310 [Microvirga sp.]